MADRLEYKEKYCTHICMLLEIWVKDKNNKNSEETQIHLCGTLKTVKSLYHVYCTLSLVSPIV